MSAIVKNLIPHFIEQQLNVGQYYGEFDAYGMSIDLSGFTRLTQSLTKQGNVGAEQISLLLNNIFSPIVSLVYQQGGFIPYYAGDAFTAIFPLPPSKEQLQRILQTAHTASNIYKSQLFFGTYSIGVKIGMAHGHVVWGIVGKELKSFYFRGDLIDNCAKGQGLAKKEEIVVHESLFQSLTDSVQLNLITPEFYLLDQSQLTTSSLSQKSTVGIQSQDTLRQFLPPQILDSKLEGEFRSVVTVFLSFENINSHEQLDEFATIVLDLVQNFSGYLKEIDFGDKGGIIPIFFGAPVSFENNAERALEFVLSMTDQLSQKFQDQVYYRIGMTVGDAFTGSIGCAERCQYAVVGNHVNLAARLMMYANWFEVLTDEDLHKTRQFQFKHKGNIRYKGFEGDIPTYHLFGRNMQNKFTFKGIMMGRETELAELEAFAEPMFENQFAGVAYLFGEAGIGKSRLAFEFKDRLNKKRPIGWFICKSDQILRRGMNPFIYFLRFHFSQSLDASPEKNKQLFEQEFYGLLNALEQTQSHEKDYLIYELKRTQSILAGLLDINYEGALWDQLDAKGRFQNVVAALTALFLAESLLKPIVIFLEDGHWFDDLSKEFTYELVRKLEGHRALVLITSRYNQDDNSKPYLFDGTAIPAPFLEIDLNFLSDKAILHFAMNQLDGTISEDFHKLLIRTTNGNPFYLEQMLEYFVESGMLIKQNDDWTIKDPNIKLSNSINAILTARIDRLSLLVKETVKAAAVIGQEFDLPVLSEVMMGQEGFIRRNGDSNKVLAEQIAQAEKGQIWQAMTELRYIFKHSLLREAVYGMQLRTRLRELHQQIGEAIERLYADNPQQRYFDLAFHFEQAEIPDKTDYYLKKAAEYASRNFQNRLAIRYYGKLLGRVKKGEGRVEILLTKGELQELVGEWTSALKTYEEALHIARQLNDKKLLGYCNIEYGDLLLKLGQYEDARMYLEIGATFFEFDKDKEGMSKAYGSLGNLYFRQGEYEEAKAYYIQSIEIDKQREQSPAPSIIANLGLTYMNQGAYQQGIQWQEEGIEDAKRNNDKPGLANLFTSTGIVYFEKGDYIAALENYEKGLALSEELGDKHFKAIAIGCIGKVYEKQGDYDAAMQNYEEDLHICEELGDKQGVAIALVLIGELYSLIGDFEQSIAHVEKALTINEELGYQKGIAKAVNILGDIYYYKQDFTKSIFYYDQAIDVTRKINNKLVLGFSLIEKGRSMLAAGLLDGVANIQEEATKLANELGNPDLIFESAILTIRLLHKEGKATRAVQLGLDLLAQHQEKTKQATIHYELNKVVPTLEEHSATALKLYQELYEDIPQFAFKRRIDALS